jgi:hypothetical protein
MTKRRRAPKSPRIPRPSIASYVTWQVPDFPDTPDGLCGQFCAIAEHCLEDAKKLDALSEGYCSPAEYILIAHALELSLKAFLAKHGLKEEAELRRDFVHNLDKLYKTASDDYGLDLSSSTPDAKRIIAWVNEYHSGGDPIRHQLRYAAKTRHCLEVLLCSRSLMRSCSRQRPRNRKGACIA